MAKYEANAVNQWQRIWAITEHWKYQTSVKKSNKKATANITNELNHQDHFPQ
jgi:hypothetical protein